MGRAQNQLLQQELACISDMCKKIDSYLKKIIKARIGNGLMPLNEEEAANYACLIILWLKVNKAIDILKIITNNIPDLLISQIIFDLNILVSRIEQSYDKRELIFERQDNLLNIIKQHFTTANLTVAGEIQEKIDKLKNLLSKFLSLYYTAIPIISYLNIDDECSIVMSDLDESKILIQTSIVDAMLNISDIGYYIKAQDAVQDAIVILNVLAVSIKLHDKVLTYIFTQATKNFSLAIKNAFTCVYPSLINYEILDAKIYLTALNSSIQVKVENIAYLCEQIKSFVNLAIEYPVEDARYAKALITQVKLKQRLELLQEGQKKIADYFASSIYAGPWRIINQHYALALREIKRAFNHEVAVDIYEIGVVDVFEIDPMIDKIDLIYINWYLLWSELKKIMDANNISFNYFDVLKQYDADFKHIVTKLVATSYDYDSINELKLKIEEIILFLDAMSIASVTQKFSNIKGEFKAIITATFSKPIFLSQAEIMQSNQELMTNIMADCKEAKALLQREQNFNKYHSSRGVKFFFWHNKNNNSKEFLISLMYLGAGNSAKAEECLTEQGERVVVKISLSHPENLQQDKDILKHLPSNFDENRSKLLGSGQYMRKNGSFRKFIVMEKAPGIELRHAALSYNKRNYLPLTVNYAIALKIIDEVIKLHKQNIVHCDLKEDNIIVYIDESGEVKISIIDFGMACRISASLGFRVKKSYFALPIASSPQCAPELRHPFDVYVFGTDVYSLGYMFANKLMIAKEITQGMIVKNIHKRDSPAEARYKLLNYMTTHNIPKEIPKLDMKKFKFFMHVNCISRYIADNISALSNIREYYAEILAWSKNPLVFNETEQEIIASISFNMGILHARLEIVTAMLAKIAKLDAIVDKNPKNEIKLQLKLLILELHEISNIISAYLKDKNKEYKDFFNFIDGIFVMQCRVKEYMAKILQLDISSNKICISELHTLNLSMKLYTMLYKLLNLAAPISIICCNNQDINQYASDLNYIKNSIKRMVAYMIKSNKVAKTNLIVYLMNNFNNAADIADKFIATCKLKSNNDWLPQEMIESFVNKNNVFKSAMSDMIIAKEDRVGNTMLLWYDNYKATASQVFDNILRMDPVRTVPQYKYLTDSNY